MIATSPAEFRWWVIAVLAFLAFAALGAAVSGRTPSFVDIQAAELRGQVPPLAAFFTGLGRWYVLLPLATFALAGAYFARAPARDIAWLIATQVVSQAASTSLKFVFHRVRPDYWLVYKEIDFSYPSGHSTTAVVFFVGILLVFAREAQLPRPASIAVISALAICALGLPWSRLALGAHYGTDIVGGLLFGLGWLCVAIALGHRFGAFQTIGA